MTCQCSLNAAETTILTACPLHEAWLQQRERERLEKVYALFTAADDARRDATRKAGAR